MVCIHPETNEKKHKMKISCTAEEFVPFLNKELVLEVVDGPELSLTLKDIKEKEGMKLPFDDEEIEVRNAFSLLLKGSLEKSISPAGNVNIKGLSSGEVESVYMTRITPLSSDPSAWYQIIFN